MLGIGKEITERRRLVPLPEQETAVLRTIVATTVATTVATAPDLLVLRDRDSVYPKVNPAFCATAGRSEEAILGRTDHEPPWNNGIHVWAEVHGVDRRGRGAHRRSPNSPQLRW